MSAQIPNNECIANLSAITAQGNEDDFKRRAGELSEMAVRTGLETDERPAQHAGLSGFMARVVSNRGGDEATENNKASETSNGNVD